MKTRNRKATTIAAVFLLLVLVYTCFLIWGHSTSFRLVKETHVNEITIEKILNDYPAKDSMQTNP